MSSVNDHVRDRSSVLLPTHFYEDVFDLVAHAVFVKNRSGRYVLLNKAAAELIGKPREQLLGKTDADLFPDAEAAARREDDLRTLSGGVPLQLPEQQLTDSEGVPHVMATTKTPLLNEQGRATHVVGVALDVTELKRLETSLRLTNERLEARVSERTAELERVQKELLLQERSSILGRIAGALAHQLRNSLAVILNASSILGREKNHLPESDSALLAIREEVRSASQTLRNLLSHTETAGPCMLPTAVADVVDCALASLDVPSDVALHVEVARQLEIEADARQLALVLRNLLSNSIEAMPDGGHIFVRAGLSADTVDIRVRDTGPGVEGGAASSMFEPLVSSKPLGLGIGLSASRALVENQGGRLTYVAGAGGAEFELSMPRGNDRSGSSAAG